MRRSSGARREKREKLVGDVVEFTVTTRDGSEKVAWILRVSDGGKVRLRGGEEDISKTRLAVKFETEIWGSS